MHSKIRRKIFIWRFNECERAFDLMFYCSLLCCSMFDRTNDSRNRSKSQWVDHLQSITWPSQCRIYTVKLFSFVQQHNLKQNVAKTCRPPCSKKKKKKYYREHASPGYVIEEIDFIQFLRLKAVSFRVIKMNITFEILYFF